MEQNSSFNWKDPSEEELISMEKKELTEVKELFLQLFFKHEIEKLETFRYIFSPQQKKQLKEVLFKYRKDDIQKYSLEKKPPTLEFLEFVSEKNFWFVPLSFIFCYILQQETDSFECFFWFIENKDITEVLQVFDQLTPNQSFRLFHSQHKWEKNLLEKNKDSSHLKIFMEEFNRGVVKFSCRIEKNYAPLFSHLLYLLKTRFWNEDNSFTCCLGVLISMTEVFDKDMLMQILSFYATTESTESTESTQNTSPKKRSYSHSGLIIPPAPKKTARVCALCQKKTAVVCHSCKTNYCKACLHHSPICVNCQDNL